SGLAAMLVAPAARRSLIGFEWTVGNPGARARMGEPHFGLGHELERANRLCAIRELLRHATHAVRANIAHDYGPLARSGGGAAVIDIVDHLLDISGISRAGNGAAIENNAHAGKVTGVREDSIHGLRPFRETG